MHQKRAPLGKGKRERKGGGPADCSGGALRGYVSPWGLGFFNSGKIEGLSGKEAIYPSLGRDRFGAGSEGVTSW